MRPLRLGVYMDPPGEGWLSMDVAGEELLRGLRALPGVEPLAVRPGLPRLVRRLPGLAHRRAAFNADRVLTRHLLYPTRALLAALRPDVCHVVDHSYAQLVHALPVRRTGVYCHDLDAFRCVLTPAHEPRPGWFRALARRTLQGMQRARRVFYSTAAVRDELLAHRVVAPGRLVHAPLGVSAEFSPRADPGEAEDALLRELGGRPFLFHVGSPMPRKRLDVLLQVFAGVRARHPSLMLVQLGGRGSAEVERWARVLGLGDALVLPPPLPRVRLARLYRGARLVLVPSEAEGFGLPVIEALASGAEVVATDLPVLREVGADALHYAPLARVDAWVDLVSGLLEGSRAAIPEHVRLARAERFRWQQHARTILAAYEELLRERSA